MKKTTLKSLLATLSFMFFLTCITQGQPQKLSTPFEQITSVIPVSNNQLLVTQQKGDFRALLYNIARDSISHRFISAGLGFGQSEGIRTAGYDENKGQFIFYTRFRRWIKTDTTGNVMSETVTHIPFVKHICTAPDNAIQVFSKQSISADDIQNNKPFVVSHRVDLEKMQAVDSVMATPEMLQLDQIENINKANLLSFDFIGHKLNDNRLILTYTGSKHLFLFEGDQLKKKVPVNIPGNSGLKITGKEGKVGIQAAGVFTNLQQLNNGTLLFSMGNTHQNLPLGAIYVTVSDNNKVIVRHEKIYDSFGDITGGYNHIYTGKHRIWFSEYFFTAYSLYKEPLNQEN